MPTTRTRTRTTAAKTAPKAPNKAAQQKAPARAALDLALQGGGSHGAFTWGVLDRLLQDETLTIDGISGTSAGALNAAVLACGWVRGGRSGARQALESFWLDVAGQGACFGSGGSAPNPLAFAFPPALAAGFSPALSQLSGLQGFNLDRNPLYAWMQQFLRLASPYQFNPFDVNPLRDVLRRHVDAKDLKASRIALFVTATAVTSGRPRIFHRDELTLDALLASACLPHLFRAVVVDGEPYWDGGYSGNPALWPLIYETEALDLLLVKINPLERPELPDTSEEITDRINEITFNAGLVAEMRAISFVQKLVREGRLDGAQYKNLRLHMIGDEVGLAPLHPSSKLNTDRVFLERLRDLGRNAADGWLARHRSDVGVRGTLDAAATFFPPQVPVATSATSPLKLVPLQPPLPPSSSGARGPALRRQR